MTFLRLSALAFATTALGCAGLVESGLRDASARRAVPDGFQVTYDDHTEMLGGDRIEVTAEGVLRWWRFRPGFVTATSTPEQHLEGPVELPPTPATPPTVEARIAQEDLVRLVDVLLAVEPWDQRSVPDDTRVEQRRAVVEVRIRGERERIWEWVGEDGRDDGPARIRLWAEESVAPILGAMQTVAPEQAPVRLDDAVVDEAR